MLSIVSKTNDAGDVTSATGDGKAVNAHKYDEFER